MHAPNSKTRWNSNDGATARIQRLLGFVLLARLLVCLLVIPASAQVNGTTITAIGGTPAGGSGTNFQSNTITLKLKIVNNEATTQTFASAWPSNPQYGTIKFALPSGNNGYSGGVGSDPYCRLNIYDTNNLSISATVAAGGTITVSKVYNLQIGYVRTQGTTYPNYVYVPSNDVLQPYTSSGDLIFSGTLNGVSKTYTFPLTLIHSTSTTYPSTYLNLGSAAELTVTLNIGGNPTPTQEPGTAKFVLNTRGKMAAGNKVRLRILKDTKRGLAEEVFENLGTTAAGTTEADMQQFSQNLPNPLGFYNERQYVWEITSADGKTKITTVYGRSPKWNGNFLAGGDQSNPTPDYGFVTIVQATVTGLAAATNPNTPATNTYNPDTSANPSTMTKKDHYEAMNKALSDALGKAPGSTGTAGAGEGAGDLSGSIGLGEGMAAGVGFDGDGGLGGGSSAHPSLGSSPTITIAGKLFDLRIAEPYVSWVRACFVAILAVVAYLTGARIVRGASAN